MIEKSFFALVQGKYYQGDIEGQRYHWRKGIPGSKQLIQDLERGAAVAFIYYRTLDRETKRGKYFYGVGTFENSSLRKASSNNQIEYFAKIINYAIFPVPVSVGKDLWQKIWPGANRQPGIKRISEEVFSQISQAGLRPSHINMSSSVLGEKDVEGLLNGQLIASDIKDREGHEVVKRLVKTTVYKRSQQVIRRLKKHYKGLCQITGEVLSSLRDYGVDVTEAHHIHYLSDGGLDADPSNIIILSPEWHRVLHKENPEFNRKELSFIFSSGRILPVKYPGHLKQSVDDEKKK